MKTNYHWLLVLLVTLTVQITFAQEKTISGIVSDDTGPLPGVTIIKKGTSIGTETDFDGKYSIKAKTGDVIVFSFLGMETEFKTISRSNTYNIVMVADNNVLNEVVVTAFGRKKQARSLGYSATKVTKAELTEVTNSNPFESLSGKIAGVDFSIPSQPGASAKIISRGFSSISGSSAPLYIVDGSPISDSSNGNNTSTSSFDAGSGAVDIDPNNIESINFLKGSVAAALYGNRASNGAIIITTKKGRGKIKVDISSSVELLEVGKLVESQQQFGTGWNGLSYSNVSGEGSLAASNENGSWGAAFDGQIRPWSRIVDDSQLLKPYSPLKDNVRDFFDIGTVFTNSITLSGGSENADVALTYSRVEGDGVIPSGGDTYTKNNIGLNAGLSFDKIKIRSSINYINKQQTAVPNGQGDSSGYGNSLMQELIQIPNDISIVDLEDQSNIFNTPSYFYTPFASNPYSAIENNQVSINKDRIFGNINFNYIFNDHFNLIYQIGTDVENEYIKRTGAIVDFVPGSPQDIAATPTPGAVGEFKYTTKELDTYINLNYSKDINEDLTFDGLIGANYNQRSFDLLGVVVQDLDLPDFYELSNSASTPSVTQIDVLRRSYSFFTNLELAYKNKYFLTLTGRNDRTSTLPLKNNSYFYPSASLSAIVLESSKSFLKLRGGIAQVANDTDPYRVFATAGQAVNTGYFGSITYPFGGQNSFEIFGTVENQNLEPEIVTEIELGAEGKFFNNRISFDVAVYDKTTKGLITSEPLPRSTGFSAITGNAFDLNNKGIEILLSFKPVKTENFEWNINYTFTKNVSKVSLPDDIDQVLLFDAFGTSFVAEDGEALGSFYAPTPEKNDAGQYIVDPLSGYYTYDGTPDYIGSSQRDFIMGLQNEFKYKNLKLSFNWDWKKGGLMYSYTKRLSYFVGNAIETTYNDRQSFIIPNSVVDNGDGTYSENTTYVDSEDVTGFYNTSSNQAIESEHLIDKSFIRLRSLALSYSINPDLLKGSGLTKLSFSLYGKNLFLWTPSGNTYVDPETTTYGNGLRSEFGEFATNPAQRAYGLNVKLSF